MGGGVEMTLRRLWLLLLMMQASTAAAAATVAPRLRGVIPGRMICASAELLREDGRVLLLEDGRRGRVLLLQMF